MRLIDADVAIEIAHEYMWSNEVDEMKFVLEKAPTIEAEPVRHGRWDSKGYCTNCGNRCIGNDYEEWRTKYCPYCGAKMKGTFTLD